MRGRFRYCRSKNVQLGFDGEMVVEITHQITKETTENIDHKAWPSLGYLAFKTKKFI